jgi:hypothetical protein
MHDGTEEDVDGDWVDEDDAAVGEGGEGLGRKMKEAAVSEDGGDPTQIPKEAFFFLMIVLRERKEAGIDCNCDVLPLSLEDLLN